jgi:hypothetical protein
MSVLSFSCNEFLEIYSSMVSYYTGDSLRSEGQTAYIFKYDITSSTISENLKKEVSEGSSLCTFQAVYYDIDSL